MYLEDIKVIFMQPCTQPGGNVLFKAKFSRDISEILPYINSILNQASYNHKSCSLTFKKGFTLITLRGTTLSVCKALNETNAYEIIDMIRDLVNDTHSKMKSIEPFYEMRCKPTALEIYKYLPKNNCKKCNEATCIAFATKLLLGTQSLNKCSVLYEENNADNLNELKDIVQMLGYE